MEYCKNKAVLLKDNKEDVLVRILSDFVKLYGTRLISKLATDNDK